MRNEIESYYQKAIRKACREYVNRNNLIIDSKDLKTDYSTGEVLELDDKVNHLSPTNTDYLSNFRDEVQKDNDIELPRIIWSYKQPFVTTVDEVFIFGPYALPITRDGKIIGDVIFWDPYKKHYDSGIAYRKIENTFRRSPLVFSSLLLGHRPECQTMDVGVILRGNELSNYYSWIIKHLPRLRNVFYYRNEKEINIKYIIPKDSPDFVYESLAFFGINLDDVIEWKGDGLKINQLIVPSHPEPTPGTLEWLRNTAVDRLGEQRDPSLPDWIFISRQKTGRRQIANFEEFNKILKRYDIEPICIEELSFTQQVELFTQAEGIIGVMGAGLTNQIWGYDLDIIEIFGDGSVDCYCTISNILDHNHIPVLAQIDDSGTSQYQSQRDKRLQDLYVNIDRIEQKLEALA